MRFSVRVWSQNALFRRVRFSSPAQTWRRLTEKRTLQPGPHGKAHSTRQTSRKSAVCNPDFTEKRTPQPGPHGKAQSARQTSRRSALCDLGLTEKRTLRVKPHGEAHSVPAAHQKAHSARERPPRLRLYVRRRGQTALFRRVRFSSPAQTWRRLTEKRTLRVKPHGEAHSATAP